MEEKEYKSVIETLINIAEEIQSFRGSYVMIPYDETISKKLLMAADMMKVKYENKNR